MIRKLVVALATAFLAASAFAHDYQLKLLRIEHPFARATPPAAKAAGAFLTIKNTGTQADRLIRAASPVAGVVELHEMAMDGNVMKMQAVPAIDVPAGGKVELKPGGYHVMLMELKDPLVEGKEVPLSLTFEKSGTIDVKLKVESMGSSGHKH
jgi:copper(I)-binding protein